MNEYDIEEHVKYRMGKYYNEDILTSKNVNTSINLPLFFIRKDIKYEVISFFNNSNYNNSKRISDITGLLCDANIFTKGFVYHCGDSINVDDFDICIFGHNRNIDRKNSIIFPLLAPHLLSITNKIDKRFFGNLIDDGMFKDCIDYEDKTDDIVWRGKLTGSLKNDNNGQFTSINSISRAINCNKEHLFFKNKSIEEIFLSYPRYSIVKRYCSRFNIKLNRFDYTASKRINNIFNDDMFGKYYSNSDILKYKYILVLEGNDNPSSLATMLKSNSLILMPERRWDDIFTIKLTPWEHYIPLDRFANNLDERLEWCRTHPLECRRIVENSSNYINEFTLEREYKIWTRMFEIYNENVEII